MLQSIPSIGAWPFASDETHDASAHDIASEGRDPGFVYLSVSRTMPGFVQIASTQEDPTGQTWSLQTFSGVTKFRNVCVVRTSDCRELEERFRKAVSFDQIPHHSDLFKLPLRFARQILEEEVQALPASGEWVRPAKKLPTWAFVAFSAATVLLGGGLLQMQSTPEVAQTRPAAQKVVAQVTAPKVAPKIVAAPVVEKVSAPAVESIEPAPAPQLIKPQFRISKM